MSRMFEDTDEGNITNQEKDAIKQILQSSRCAILIKLMLQAMSEMDDKAPAFLLSAAAFGLMAARKTPGGNIPFRMNKTRQILSFRQKVYAVFAPRPVCLQKSQISATITDLSKITDFGKNHKS